jgi:23S rRNA-/tRNA-specific pseudouridylate synthase
VRIPPVRVAEKAETPAPGRSASSLLDRVIYRDDALLVIDKPAGQAVHGGSGVSLGIIEQLRQELPEARFLELAHRLDKETSGVLVLALKRSALVELHRMLREGETRKTYLALAVGDWRDPSARQTIPAQIPERRRASAGGGGRGGPARPHHLPAGAQGRRVQPAGSRAQDRPHPPDPRPPGGPRSIPSPATTSTAIPG